MITLLFIVPSILLLVGTALAIPARPAEYTSICRSRPDGSAASSLPVPVATIPTRLGTTKPEP
jgi:hypothetical protein